MCLTSAHTRDPTGTLQSARLWACIVALQGAHLGEHYSLVWYKMVLLTLGLALFALQSACLYAHLKSEFLLSWDKHSPFLLCSPRGEFHTPLVVLIFGQALLIFKLLAASSKDSSLSYCKMMLLTSGMSYSLHRQALPFSTLLTQGASFILLPCSPLHEHCCSSGCSS